MSEAATLPAPPAASTTRRAPIGATTLDREARTVTVIAATGAPVQRTGFRPDGSFGAWIEELDVRGADTSRLSGGPVLADHIALTDYTIGVVERAWTERAALMAQVRFAKSERGETAMQNVGDGILRGVSIGYRVEADGWERQDRGRSDVPVWRAARWQILEVSFVPIPADPAAGVRSAEDVPLSRTTPMEFSMSATLPAEAPATPIATAEADATRNTNVDDVITAAERLLGRDEAATLRQRATAEGLTVEQTRHAAFARAAELSRGGRDAPPIRPTHTGGATFDNPTFLRETMAEALACRAGVGSPSAQAREFMHMRMSDMAAHLLQSRGINTRGMTPSQIITRAHSTSDFPNLLQNTGNRLLLAAFEPAASGLRSVMRMRTASDFRTLSTIRASGVDRLAEVAQGGAVTLGSAFEKAETYRVRTFARGFVMTREAMVNDDLGAFDTLRVIGRAAAQTEAEEFHALLSANRYTGPTMSDSAVLYSTARGNLASSGAALDVTTLSTGRASMRAQTDLNGVKVQNVPRYILCGPTVETAAEQVVATITAATTSNVNPFSGRLEVVVEPLLTTNAWYLFADPTASPVFEMATLEMNGGMPQIEVFTEAGTLGVTLRAVHDFGCGAVSPIGTWRNPGA